MFLVVANSASQLSPCSLCFRVRALYSAYVEELCAAKCTPTLTVLSVRCNSFSWNCAAPLKESFWVFVGACLLYVLWPFIDGLWDIWREGVMCWRCEKPVDFLLLLCQQARVDLNGNKAKANWLSLSSSPKWEPPVAGSSDIPKQNKAVSERPTTRHRKTS